MHDARAVANYVLNRAWEMGFEVSQIDIQKICYFLHGHHLVEHGIPLIKTEFEAWEYGPVQRVLYASFKKFEKQPITEEATAFDPIRRTEKQLPPITENSAIATIENHLVKYLEIPSFGLVDITHASGTPWSETMSDAENTVNVGMRISDQKIQEKFEGLGV
jgi:uncharacterized phage-associated protein